MAIIEAKNVVYRYENKYQTVHALNGVNASFEEGMLYALVGKSGSGKSTLLSLMAGLMLPSEGEILFRGQPTSSIDLNRYRRDMAAVIYQSFRLLPLLTVLENVTYPMELRGFKGKKAKEKAVELIRKVGLPDSVLNRFPGMLSGGEQQRVAIARAMSMESKLMLADEPTGNLDTENSRRVIDLLLSLAHEDGYCVVVVTHDPEISAKADITYRIRDGVLYEEQPDREVRSDGTNAEAQKKWGDTEAYKEYAEKSAQYTDAQQEEIAAGMDAIFKAFAACKNDGDAADSEKARELVKTLQAYITEHYYNCTDEILRGLAEMYVADERFRKNIDRHGDGTAAFVREAIRSACTN